MPSKKGNPGSSLTVYIFIGESVFRDIRFGIRMLRKQPSFAVICTLTLALGIGATAAVFSLIQGVLLTPPPYQQPGRLVLISAAKRDGKPNPSGTWPAQQWTEWRTHVKSLKAVAGHSWRFNFLVRNEGSESMEGMAVSGDYFKTLGLKAFLGRTFSEAETAYPTAPVVLIGYDLWQRAFNGDPKIVGKPLRMSRSKTPPTIIGVMPPGARFLPSPSVAEEPNYNVNAQVDFWLPNAPDPKALKDAYWNVVARLSDCATGEMAQQELSATVAREGREDRDFEGFMPKLTTLPNEMNREGRRILLPLLGAAGLVLLIACGNAAALLLVRGLQRQQEYAVRSALGAGRLGLFRQVTTESLLIALAGGALGVGLAFALVKIFTLAGGHAIPRLDSVKTGWPVLAWGMGSAIFAAFIAGVFPAMRASRLDPASIIKGSGPNSSAGPGERRLMRGVTVIQTALTLALLVGAGLLIRTMNNISLVRSGFTTSRVLTMSVTAVQGNWSAFHHQALERVAAIGGVDAAAFAWGVPLTGNDWQAGFDIEGVPPATKGSDRLRFPLRSVTPGYFALLNLPIIEGRDFRPIDDEKAPKVAIVNQAFVDRYFPNGAALGKKLWFGSKDNPPNQIIGVIANTRTGDLTQPPEPEIYAALWQFGAFSKHLVVRTKADPRTLVGAIQRELRKVDSTVAIENAKTLEQIRSDSLASRSFAMDLLIGFSLVGSVLTLVGIYGVLSLSVASRKRELAIRTAVGAQPNDLRHLVLAEGLRLIAAGVGLGIAIALGLVGALRSFLFGLQPTDPANLVSVGLLFFAVALLACWVPTQRAAKANPLGALRCE